MPLVISFIQNSFRAIDKEPVFNCSVSRTYNYIVVIHLYCVIIRIVRRPGALVSAVKIDARKDTDI